MSRPAAAWAKKPSDSASPGPGVPLRVAGPAARLPKVARSTVQESTSSGSELRLRAGALGTQAQRLAVAGMVSLITAIAVMAIAALVIPDPIERRVNAAGGPEIGAALAPTDATSTVEDSPVSQAVASAFQNVGEPVAQASLGAIRIPSIDLDAKYYAGVHDAVVAQGPGLWPGTPLPGHPGNSVFAGHRTTHTHPFRDLDRLKPGDLIEASTGFDLTTQFRVVSVKTVRESEYVDYALAAPEPPEAVSITLLACAPKGSRTHRIVLRAEAIPATQGAERGDA